MGLSLITSLLEISRRSGQPASGLVRLCFSLKSILKLQHSSSLPISSSLSNFHISAVEGSVCLWVLIVHDDNQTVGGHLFLNVLTYLLPAHPFVHPSTDRADKCVLWDGFRFLLVNTFKRKVSLNIGGCQGISSTHYTAVFVAKALIILMPLYPAGCPWLRLPEHQQRLHPVTPRPPAFGT